MQNPFDRGYYCSEVLRTFGFKSIGENVQIAKDCTIVGVSHIAIGDHVRIDAATTLIATAPMTFGNRIHIGGHCHFCAAEPLLFCDYSGTSQGVRIYTASDDYTGKALMGPMVPAAYRKATRRPVTLARYAVVGSNSVLLPGANVEEGSVVGAMSLVTKTLAPWGVYFGVPVKRLKDRKRDIIAMAEQIEADDAHQAAIAAAPLRIAF